MKVRKVPERKCLGCGEMKEKKALIRVVRSPEGIISVDKSGKKPGRGAYVCQSRECVAKAISARALEKALGVKISDEVCTKILEELAE
ncbi:MAG: YlxR family protein [Acidaminococcaceae bacterium]|nr:YlxR family protein [Acidaminococcaceae bacterium]